MYLCLLSFNILLIIYFIFILSYRSGKTTAAIDIILNFNDVVSDESLAANGKIKRLILVHGAGSLQPQHQELVDKMKAQGVKQIEIFDKFPTELFSNDDYWNPPIDGEGRGQTALLLDDCLEVRHSYDIKFNFFKKYYSNKNAKPN